MIPDKAIEAAAKVMQAKDARESFGEYPLWEYTEDVTAILEAAAPYMQLRELLDGVQREIDEAKTMTDILVDHQRQSSSACLCGWAKLGHSHPEHQADALSAAGFRRPAG